MNKKSLIFFSLIFCALTFLSPCLAEVKLDQRRKAMHMHRDTDSISSIQLINKAKDYDGKEVIYEGEAIGDIMRRGREYAWVNVNDGDNAIGVWSPWDSVKEITKLGSYKYKGDLLKIIGRFNRACLQHGGDLDIHAQKIEILQKGRRIVEHLNLQKVRLAVVSGILLLVLMIFQYFQRKISLKKG